MVKTPRAKLRQTSKRLLMTAMPLGHREMKMASPVKSAAATAMAVNAAPGASAKIVLICASRFNKSPRKSTREKPLRLSPLCQHQCPVRRMLRQLLHYKLRDQSPPALRCPVLECPK